MATATLTACAPQGRERDKPFHSPAGPKLQ